MLLRATLLSICSATSLASGTAVANDCVTSNTATGLHPLTAAEIQSINNQALKSAISTSEIGGGESRIELLTGTSSSRVSLTWGQSQTGLLSFLGQSPYTTFANTKITLSAPLNKKEQFSDLARFDELTNGIQLSASFTNYARTTKPEWNADFFATTRAAIFRECKRRGECGAKVREENISVTGQCVSLYAPALRDEFDYELTGADIDEKRNTISSGEHGAHFLYGVSASIGHQEFDFLDETSLAISNTKKTPWEVGGHLGILPATRQGSDGRNTLLLVGAKYQKKYKSAKTRTLCSPPDALGLQDCSTPSIGEPSTNEKTIIFGEIRHQFDVKFLSGKQGLSIRSSYDLKNDEFELDAPVYLFSDKKNNLNGGVRLNWNDKRTDEFIVGLFIGANFSLLPG